MSDRSDRPASQSPGTTAERVPAADMDEVADGDPFDALQSWYQTACQHEPADPNAMTMATVDASGAPNARIVLMKDIDEASAKDRGIVFYTNLESAKGQELAVVGKAACVLHWKSLERQVRLRGLIAQVSDEEADAYFASRPRDSRIGAWASRQSRSLPSRDVLKAAVSNYDSKFSGEDVPRPPHWSGFRLTPLEIESWCARPYRLHDRFVFRRQRADQNWQVTRLYP